MQQKIIFTRGINSDTAAEFMTQGEARSRINARVLSSDNAEIGGAETVLGNTLVSYTLPSGNNKVIGSKEYAVQNMVYYFVYNDTKKHSILQYDIPGNIITLVLQEAVMAPFYLNFDIDSLITGINFVELDKSNHLLYWTDNYVNPDDKDFYNEPKKLNIEKAINFSRGDYTHGYPLPFSPEFIYRIKKPMALSPLVEYGTDPNRSINKLKDKLFQFKIQYVFDDKEVSAWSPITVTPFPLSLNPALGDNQIILTFDTGSSIIKRIRVAVKQVNDTDFSLVVDLDKGQLEIPNDFVYSYSFYNDGNYLPLEINESIKLFDNVPKRSKSQEIIKGDRLVDGLITENFDPTDIDFKINLNLHDEPVAVAGIVSHATLTSAGHGYGYASAAIFGDGTGATASVKLNPITFVVDSVVITNSGENYTFATVVITGDGAGATATITILPILLPIQSLKRGGAYIDGIVYYDHANRSGATNTNEGNFEEVQSNGKYGNSLCVPFYTEAISQYQDITFSVPDGTFYDGEDLIFYPSGSTARIVTVDNTALTMTVFITSGTFGGLTDTALHTIGYLVGTGAGASANIFPYLVKQGISGKSYPVLDWEIYNLAPKWATHWQFVRVKNSANDRYIQFVANGINYLGPAGTPLTFGDPTITTMQIDISNIYTEFKDQNPGSILIYDFIKGDRIRFIKDQSAVFVPEYFDFEIGDFDTATGNIYVIFPNKSVPPNFPNLQDGFLFEIYQPQLVIPTDDKITFEHGNGGAVLYDSVNDIYIHDGDVQSQAVFTFDSSGPYLFFGGSVILSSSTGLIPLAVGDKVKIVQDAPFNNPSYNTYAIVTATPSLSSIVLDVLYGVADPTVTGKIIVPALGNFDVNGQTGDTFYRNRHMPDGFAVFIDRMVEDANYSDLYLSPGYDYGRPNRIDKNFKEVTRLSTVYYSELFIAETQINGFSSVLDTSFQTYESKYGGIYKLFSKEQVLIAFQELKVGEILVNQITIGDLSVNNLVGASNVVLNPQMRYDTAEFGIGKNAESFSVYANSIYFVDIKRGAILRRANDGTIPISDIGNMHNAFTALSKKILDVPVQSKIYGVYDIKFGEYIIAIEEIVLEPAGIVVPATTLAFNEKDNAFSTYYTYYPDFMCGTNTGIVSFKNGSFYKHNSNSVYNNFYGVQYKSEMWIVFNANPSNVKVLQAISEESNDTWEIYEISTPNGQLSNLLVTDFREIENNQFASVLRDTNTPNVTYPTINGDVMRDRTMLVKFRYPNAIYNKINAVNFYYALSNLNNRV